MKLEEVVQFLTETLRTYDVRHVSPSYMRRLGGRGTLGLTNFGRKKVYIRNDLRGYDHDRVLMHEFAHIYLEDRLNGEPREGEVWDAAYGWLRVIYGAAR